MSGWRKSGVPDPTLFFLQQRLVSSFIVPYFEVKQQQEDKRLSGEEPKSPAPQRPTFSEPEQIFRLAEFVGRQGTSTVDCTEPSLLLVLTGKVWSGARRFVPGDATPCRDSRLRLESGTKLWQLTGSSRLLGDLEHFATRLRHKDAEVAAHGARVALLAADIGQRLGFSTRHLERLSLAAYLHDVGKLKLPTHILQTPDSLTPCEWQLMTQHPSYGRQLLEATTLFFLAPIIEHHHERLDGSGYPFGLGGDAVAVEGYVIAVADTFDAITHARPYRQARSPQHALSEINRYSGVLYPREVVGALNAVTRSFSC